MSSVVYNNNNNNNNNINNSINNKAAAAAELLFPTTIGSATKMYRYQHIMPMPTPLQEKLAAGAGLKTRKYMPRASTANAGGAAGLNSSSSSGGGGAPYSVDQSQSVQRRNARERNRVKQVNNSFARLRQHIPQTIIADLTKGGGRGPHKKISKVDTLRIAVEYIRRLQDLLDDLNGGPPAGGHVLPASLCLQDEDEQEQLQHHQHDDDDDEDEPEEDDEEEEDSCQSSQASSQGSAGSFMGALPALPYFAGATALQQQQQLARQQFPNHPLTPISLNAYSPAQSNFLSSAAAAAAAAAVSAVSVSSATGGCHSPTSSFNSSMSFDSGTFEAAPQQLSPSGQQTQTGLQGQTTLQSHLDAHLQLKFEPYEHFNLDEEDCTPDDEEILDYISQWQEQ